jgi:endonuclease YncB( thermonuclease family)
MTIEQQYAAEATTLDATTDQLKQVSTLVSHIRTQQQAVEQLEEQLKRAKAQLAKLTEADLPSLMDEIGLAEVTTTDGRQVAIKDTLYASVPKKNRREVAEWLVKQGHGALVAETVTAAFEKGETDKAHAAVQLLAANGYTQLSIEESVNTTSLKALIRELTSEGVDVPLPLFGAHWKRVAVIK